MKRFVIEYANYKITSIDKSDALTDQQKVERIRRIDRTATACCYNIISIDECMRVISEVSERP